MLKHENILKLLDRQFVGLDLDGCEESKEDQVSTARIVLEHCENGEIFDYIKAAGHFPTPIARFYFKQLVSAIEYIHSQGYAHRDIKPENILLDAKFNIKLADFGLSKKFDLE